MKVVLNGINTKHFKPVYSAGLKVRDEWGIDEETITIGLIVRLDPMKVHATWQ